MSTPCANHHAAVTADPVAADNAAPAPPRLLDSLPADRRTPDGPVFQAPWEAQAFAMALRLHEAGLFTWPEWAAALADQIAAAQAAGDADLGDTYYVHWLGALEHLVAAKGASTSAELAAHRNAWAHAAARTPHGQAITLGPQDFQPTG